VKFAFWSTSIADAGGKYDLPGLRVSRSGFYAGGTQPSARQSVRRKLLKRSASPIARIRSFTVARASSWLLIDGEIVSRNTVAKLMRAAKNQAKTRAEIHSAHTEAAPPAVAKSLQETSRPQADRNGRGYYLCADGQAGSTCGRSGLLQPQIVAGDDDQMPPIWSATR